MSVDMLLVTLLIALCVDGGVGYPGAVFRAVGHPVTWIGALIGWLDRTLNQAASSFAVRRSTGVVALGVIIAVPAAIAFAIQHFVASSWLGTAVLAIAVASLFASRSLYDHVRDVAGALESTGSAAETLAAGRVAVARIVGRDPDALDESGVARAAIESLAENASDGVVAPVIWFLIGGLPGLAAYKAINTADSMIGHRTPKHEAFGWASARLDDLVNLPASRLTGAMFALAAVVNPGAAPGAAVAAMARDANGHRSPNAGWPESAMAGALGLKLNGPRQYGGQITTDAYMGNGRREATAADIRRALRLAFIAWLMMLLVLALAAAIAIKLEL